MRVHDVSVFYKRRTVLSKNRAIKLQKKYSEIDNVVSIDAAHKHHSHKKIEIVPRTRNQEKLVLALADVEQHVVIATGPAGSGKTYLCLLRAIQALRNNECKRIMMVRPAVAVDNESHGFLPGDLNQKLEPWCLPLLDILYEFYKPHEVNKMIADKIIELTPLGMVRGRTFKDVFLIADEMQNSSQTQMLGLLTRIGDNSKFVITGDEAQTDRKRCINGLTDLVNRLERSPIKGISAVEFTLKDVQRHSLIGPIIDLYEE